VVAAAPLAHTSDQVAVTTIVFDDRDPCDVPFLQLNQQLNEDFCRQRGFNFQLAGGPGWPELLRMPPHWARIAHLQTRSEQLPEGQHSFLISLDSDAAFANIRFPLEQLLVALPADKSVFLAKDPPMWPPPQGSETCGVYCSGFVLLRLDGPGRNFLKRWLGSYDASRWCLGKDGSWTTDGAWAGTAYEQGQLNELAHGELAASVFELPQALFNSPWERPICRPQPVVVHLMRRPGEWCMQAKEERVAVAFAALLGKAKAAAHSTASKSKCVNFKNGDGLPRHAATLAVWEKQERDWIPARNAWCSAARFLERHMPCAGCGASFSMQDEALQPEDCDGGYLEV